MPTIKAVLSRVSTRLKRCKQLRLLAPIYKLKASRKNKTQARSDDSTTPEVATVVEASECEQQVPVKINHLQTLVSSASELTHTQDGEITHIQDNEI
ncbi:hypothetical protein IAT40_004593 [Kwoniella sp. CBS 6097]